MSGDSDFFVSDAYLQGIFMHSIFSYLFIFPYTWYLYVMFRHKSYLDMNRKIYFVMPITIFLLSVAIFTGGVTFVMRNFIMDIKIAYMIIVYIILLIGEIYRMISLRKAKTSRENMQNYIKKFSSMYIAFIILYISVILIYKV